MNVQNHFGLDQVNIAFLPADHDKKAKKELPLVISPRWDASLDFWKQWAVANRPWLDQMLLQYGAILIRGFEVESPKQVEEAIQAYQPCLNNTYRGTSPRRLLPGTEYVFSAGK
jgi:hypothetical protein